MNRNDKIAKSRLGRLLVNRGYISEDQLAEALVLQAAGNGLLGEVLIDKGYISEKDLSRTLKHQKRYRYTAAFVALATAPFQPMVAMAASPISAMPMPNNKIELSAIDMGQFGGMQMMDDSELSGVNAQGFGAQMPGVDLGLNFGQNADAVAAGFHQKYQEDEEYKEQDDEQIAGELADTVLTMVGLGPISNMIEAKVTIEGLKFQEGRSQIEVLTDGRVKMYMPTEIASISMEDIRVKGNSSGATMGSIYMTDIKYDPRSSYTIGPKRQSYF
ncbi:MAG: hypothetical protein ACI84K_000867 [Pseudohongiellaceae bacterium]